MLATLRKSVEAMGCTLTLVAQFKDRDPVVLAGYSDLSDAPAPVKDKKKRRAA